MKTRYLPTNRCVWGYLWELKSWSISYSWLQGTIYPLWKRSDAHRTRSQQRLEHHAHTSPMNHRQDRCGNPNQEKRTTRSGSKPVNLHMTKNLFHISCLLDIWVFLGIRRIGEDIEKKYGNSNMRNTYFIFMYNKAPTQHFEHYGPPSRKSGKRLRETIQCGS
jgi:hypothetical protein